MSKFVYFDNTVFPKDSGFFMPAEFSPHFATVMIWPERPGSWPFKAKKAEKVFTQIIKEIAGFEKMIVLASEKKFEHAKQMLCGADNVSVLKINSDDAWARDTAPTFVKNKSGEIRGIDWCFNAWGGEYDGLYASWENDDKIAKELCKTLDIPCYNAHPFVLEGGSIHSDGEGTLLVTEACLLSEGRNPDLTKNAIESNLKNYLGAEKVIWLPHGIYNDETNEHVDNVCAFISPSQVVLAWTDDKTDPQYQMSEACLKVLENSTDAKGRPFKVHKLPIPENPVCVQESDLKGYEFEPGEDKREAGERLAASYVNFYFCNGAVLLPQFGGNNEKSDKLALEIMQTLCKNREIIPIYAGDIILGGGNIHCITQQIPL